MNSKIAQLVIVLALVLPAAVLAQTGAAATPATPPQTAPSATKVGVISIQDAILGTNEGQKEFEALGKKFEPKRSELKALTDEIDGLKKQLDTQGSKMNDEARASLVKQIEGKQKTLSRNQEDAQNDFVGQQNEIAQKIMQKLGPVIDKYAKDNGLGLIVDASRPWPDGPVLWVSPPVDITRAVVEMYNAQSGVAPPVRPAGTGTTGSRPAGTATKPATTAPPKPQGTEPPK
jgi:outer membrane protein